MRTVYRGAVLPGTEHGRGHAQADDAGRSAVAVEDGRIAWIGPDDAVGPAGPGTEVVDLAGAMVLPAFTDAHVHVTETGLLLDGVDLSGTRSVTGLLDLVAAAVGKRPGRTVVGHGWDELRLAEGRPPTRAELDRAGGGAAVYLSRVDVHSAVLSTALAETVGARELAGWDDSGRVERDAHHAARHGTRFAIPPGEREALQRRALAAAAAAGLAELHEMSAPHVAPDADLPALVALSAEPGLPAIVPYRGEAVADAEQARRVAAGLGFALPGEGAAAGRPVLAGMAGDLMVDGSFGSRTAALHDDYADAPGCRGHLYLDADGVAAHVVACTQAGLQAGFHVIGDAAVDAVLAGFERAAAALGVAAIRAGRHRLEHLEAISAGGVAQAGRLGLTASVQPAFDAEWGGPDRMYAHRLGVERTAGLNPFAGLLAAGVPLAFGSDSPVTPFAPWEGIRAALRHRTARHRIDLAAALTGHLRAARRAGGASTAGDRLAVGDRATFATWRTPALAGHPAGLLARLERELASGAPAPVLERLVIGGQHAAGERSE